jgi:hypothetical protein
MNDIHQCDNTCDCPCLKAHAALDRGPPGPPLLTMLIGMVLLVLVAMGIAGCDEPTAPPAAECRALRVPGRATYDGQPGWLTYLAYDNRDRVHFEPENASGGKYRLDLKVRCAYVIQQRGPE